jgi:diguanylate cyclase (GGDEF)-like protein
MTGPQWLQAALFVAVVVAAILAQHLRLSRASARRLRQQLESRTGELVDLTERLDRLATTDDLTGICNRRRFSEFLGHEWNRAMRTHSTVALIMVDVDFFKRFNDTYGHLGGDDCLRRVAGVLQAVARRPGDLAARYGGEEFAVILTGTPEQSALALAESIRAGVERLQIAHESSPAAAVVTVSVGVAMASPADGGTPELLIFTADEAMYRAKEQGRNRVIGTAPAASQRLPS